MSHTVKEVIYGITVYDIKTDNNIPYQLTFERDLFYDRVNVSLVPLIDPEKNGSVTKVGDYAKIWDNLKRKKALSLTPLS